MPKTGKRGHARAVQAFGTYANPLTFGFALFLVWQNAAFSFLFPSSADQMVSPLFVGNLSAVFLLLFCVVSYKRDREAFSPAWCIGISFIATIAAIAAGILVAQTLLPLWGIYVASAIVGFSTATVAYVWTTAFAGLSARRVLVSVGIAFFLSSALDLVAMNSGYFTIPVLVGCCGVGSWVCFVLSTRAGDLETAPLLVRPTRTCEFAKLAVGIVLFAFALGIVAGTTADVCTEESMRQLNENVVLVALVVGALLLVALALGGRRVETMTLLKVFAPCLVMVILLNIVLLDYADIWLSMTMFAWSFLRLCVFLLLVEVDRHKIVSLPLAFPAAWAMLSSGYALGVFAGQNIVPLAGDGLQQLTNTIILVAVLVVVAAVLLLGNRLALGLADSSVVIEVKRMEGAEAGVRCGQDRPTQDGQVPGGMRALASRPGDAPENDSRSLGASDPQPAPTLEERCKQLTARYKLSARESEVFYYLAQGHTRASIAKKLFVSENTVREHVKSIYRKLLIHSKQQLIDLVDARR